MSLSTKGNWKQLECVIELVVATAVAIAAAAAAAPPPMWMKDGSSNLIYHSCFELFCVFDMVGTDFLTARRLWRLYEITVCMNETATTRNWVREKKERARKALNTTSNMSIKLKKNTSSYYFFHIYSFVCVCFLCYYLILIVSPSLVRHTLKLKHMHHALDSAMYRACTPCVCIFMYFIWLTVENGHIRAMASLASPAVILIVSFCNCLQCFFIDICEKSTKYEIALGVHVCERACVRVRPFHSICVICVFCNRLPKSCTHISNCCGF